MDEKELLKIQKELENNINKESDEEVMINSMADEITAMLYDKNTGYSTTINDVVYSFVYNVNNKTSQIVLTVLNRTRFKLSLGEKGFYTVKEDIDPNYSIKENLRVAVEGFIRHITDHIKPEMLDE